MFGKDGLKVGFETEAQALAWRDALKDAITRLAVGTDLVGRSVSLFQESPLGRETTQSATNMTPISSPGSVTSADTGNLAKVRRYSVSQLRKHFHSIDQAQLVIA